jgi:restriction endonuclease
VKNTFERRQTSLKSAKDRLQTEVGNEDEFQHHWETFKNRTRITAKENFKSVFEDIRSFLLPVVNAELEDISLNQVWNGRARRWE